MTIRRPAYKTSRSVRSRRAKKLIFGGLFFCLLAGLAYSLFFSAWFKISRIEIVFKQGSWLESQQAFLKKVVQEKAERILEQRIFNLFPKQNIFLFPAKRLQEQVLTDFPELKAVQISKKMPAGLIIELTGWKNIGLWCGMAKESLGSAEREMAEAATSTIPSKSEPVEETRPSQCFYLNRAGVITQEGPIMKGSLVLTIYDYTQERAQLKERVLEPRMIDFILQIEQGLALIKTKNNQTIKPKRFEILSLQDLGVVTDQGWQIYFDLNQDAYRQLQALRLVMDQEIKPEDLALLQYIDLRIEGRVYLR